jgi:uncharacterized protein (TIGR03435 family)
MTTEFVINHLWQSSCAALLAGLLAFMLRKNPPKVRYWVWLGASLKFLLPLALLVNLGETIRWPAQRAISDPPPAFAGALIQIAEPFTPRAYSAVPARVPVHWAPIVIGVAWALGFAAITFVRCRGWFRIRTVLRAGTAAELPIPIPAFIAPGAEEPGIVGFLRPVLVLPGNLLENLNPRQLEAVLAHELCHVRRRDNLFAAVHMVVEAIFWFHPLVWWIGSRMIEERELACDEEVLRMGCEPADYVEGILKVCRFYKESPLPCVSGVTGADVRKRLRAILAGNIAGELNFGRKVALTAIGLAALAAPVEVGVLNAPQVHAQSPPAAVVPADRAEAASPLVAQIAGPKGARQVAQPVAAPLQFEVASVKPVPDLASGTNVPPGYFHVPTMEDPQRFRARYNVSGPLGILEWAYGVREFQVSGAPEWLKRESFAVDAVAEHPSTEGQIRQMVQQLLADRFRLKLHSETREIPVYALTVGKDGSKLAEAKDATQNQGLGNIIVPPGKLTAHGAAMALFVQILTENLDRPVIDKTNLTGHYDFDLTYEGPSWSLEEHDWKPFGTAIFGPIQNLGLKLEPQKSPVKVLVIDSVDHPSGN